MKKLFEEPKLELVCFTGCDVLTTSGETETLGDDKNNSVYSSASGDNEQQWGKWSQN